MKPIILASVVSITTALIVYTIAVWSNWRAKVLGTAPIVLLWIGLAADATATRMMGLAAGKTTWDFHTISGNLGLGLMAVLAVVGTWAKLTGRDDILTSFHKYAVPVWIVWVISYATGVIIGVQRA